MASIALEERVVREAGAGYTALKTLLMSCSASPESTDEKMEQMSKSLGMSNTHLPESCNHDLCTAVMRLEHRRQTVSGHLHLEPSARVRPTSPTPIPRPSRLPALVICRQLASSLGQVVSPPLSTNASLHFTASVPGSKPSSQCFAKGAPRALPVVQDLSMEVG